MSTQSEIMAALHGQKQGSLMIAELDRLRLENARLFAMVNMAIEVLKGCQMGASIGGKKVYPYRIESALIVLESLPSALDWFISPTLELLKEVENEVAIHYDESDVDGWLVNIRKEIQRLTAAIGK